MGTPAFAVPTLQHLMDSGQEIAAVYSQPPRPAGRGHKQRPSPVQQLAEAHGIPVHTPTSLKSAEAQETFHALKADAAIVAAYGLLLPQAILNGCPMGCINVHPSALPRWRGAAPIQRTIMAGDTATAMCIMQMDAGLDTGDILLREAFTIPDGMTAGSLHDHMAHIAGPLVVHALEGLKNGNITPTPQHEGGALYAPKIDKAEARIDWQQPAAAIRQHILGLSPFPGAWTEVSGEKVKIPDCIIPSSCKSLTGDGVGYPSANAPDTAPPPGTILDDGLTIACGDDHAIRPTLIQRPGKKPMPTADCLRGWPILAGTQLS